METLNEIILWWHWIVFGLVLLILELLTGTFFVLIFVVSSVFVGIITLFMLLSFNSELTLWILLSLAGVVIWYKWLRGKPHEKVGQSNYRFDTLGEVTEEVNKDKRGKVRFDTPVLGNTVWSVNSDEDLKVGDKVKIVEVNGQIIKVERI